MTVDPTLTQLQTTLRKLQTHLSVIAGRPLNQGELALIANMNPRSFGEWMRGATSPASVKALLRLLSEVSAQDLLPLLEPWNEGRLQALASGSRVSGKKTTTGATRSNSKSNSRQQRKLNSPRRK